MGLLDAKSRSETDAPDAISLLKQDHEKVSSLLKEFEKASGARKAKIAQQICDELTVHAQIEEEIFYPACRRALRKEDAELVDEADVEHATIKGLVGRIDSGEASDHFDAFVTVLGEYVKHHVKEEEGEIFPKVRSSRLDLDALGAELQTRKGELMNQES